MSTDPVIEWCVPAGSQRKERTDDYEDTTSTISTFSCDAACETSHDLPGGDQFTEQDLEEQLASIKWISDSESNLTETCTVQELKSLPLFDLLSDDLLCQVASFLNVGSLKRSRLLSRRFQAVLSRNEAGWTNHCERLWKRKIHIANKAKALFAQQDESSAMEAYRLSCTDARLRHELNLEELCFDPNTNQGTIWHFRFKQSAGREWTSFDPWHNGREARRMVFLVDGTVRQLVLSGGEDRPLQLRLPFFDAMNNVGLDIRWRFVSEPMDLPRKQDGAYIRLTVGGRDPPTYIIHRSPNGNWGFLMENCWGVFASFPLPLKAPTVEGPQANPVRMRLRRASNGGGRWLNVNGIESDDEEEFDPPTKRGRRTIVDLLDDSSLTVTNRWQWREALLYNLGASSLPDGPQAVAEFNRAWNQMMRQRGISVVTNQHL